MVRRSTSKAAKDSTAVRSGSWQVSLSSFLPGVRSTAVPGEVDVDECQELCQVKSQDSEKNVGSYDPVVQSVCKTACGGERFEDAALVRMPCWLPQHH